MSSLSNSGSNDEIVNGGYTHTTLVVSTTQVEAKVGASKLVGRQMLRIYNDSNSTIYIGSTGVTASGTTKGEPLVKGQWIDIPAGDQTAVFMIAASGSNNIIVSEWA